MTRIFIALYQRDLRLAGRIGGGASMGVVFFLILVTITPFAIGPDLNLLARIGPAILWIAALLATLLAAQWVGNAPSPAWAVALCALWAAAPLWSWAASRPRAASADATLSAEDRALLHGVARDTWRYYERHVTAASHHLPPDNVQRVPHAMVAQRTSPTNIGLYLLAACCAHELGFIGSADLATRLQATLDTLLRLPRDPNAY
jgi:hypothetical protein